MVRRRWPDVVIVVAIVALVVAGVWAIWGDALLGADEAKPAVEQVQGGGGA